MSKKPSQNEEISFYPAYVRVSYANNYASFHQAIQVSSAMLPAIRAQTNNQNGNKVADDFLEYSGFFNGYGMEGIPVEIALPISGGMQLNLAYSIVKLDCRVGNDDLSFTHVVYTDHSLHYHNTRESDGLINAVGEFNSEFGSGIIQIVPINYGEFLRGNDSMTNPPGGNDSMTKPPERKFTLAVTNQPTLLLPPSPEGAENIGAYLRSSDVMSR